MCGIASLLEEIKCLQNVQLGEKNIYQKANNAILRVAWGEGIENNYLLFLTVQDLRKMK